jgi:hypothetical protein
MYYEIVLRQLISVPLDLPLMKMCEDRMYSVVEHR